jgi:hypothetical protein
MTQGIPTTKVFTGMKIPSQHHNQTAFATTAFMVEQNWPMKSSGFVPPQVKEVSMPDPDYKALCAELLADYDNCHYRSELSDRAHALLDQPEKPTDEELDELWAEIDGGGAIWAWQDFARAVLARWGRPTSEENLDG